MTYSIVKISSKYDKATSKLIKETLTEFGANKPGFAWQDPELGYLTETYSSAGSCYWIALQDGHVKGGCGIGGFKGALDTCELQKMYLAPRARGQGIGQALFDKALEFASGHYRWCYLETVTAMNRAQAFYRSNGFVELPKPLADSEHTGCDRWFIKDLQN